MEQAEHMTRHGVEPRALREFALDVGNERRDRGFAGIERRARAKDQRIDLQQPPRLLIGGAPHHDAIDMLKMLRGVFDAGYPAID